MKNKVSACLWFNGEAKSAAEFYTGVFPKSGITKEMKNTDSSPAGAEGSVLSVSFFIEEFEFLALNGGPAFSVNPAISFFVNCADENEVNVLWEKLSDGGKALMALDTYPFSRRYGWIQDKFGVSWQLMVPQQPVTQKIVPCMLFTKEQFGNAERAMDFYVSVFKNSKKGFISRYGDQNTNPDAINYGAFTLEGQDFAVMESNQNHDFHFTEGVSLMIDCKDQSEVDHYWESLTSNGGSEWQCGWLKDPFGISWQVVPSGLLGLLQQSDRKKADRTMRAMITMKKLDIAALEAGVD